MRRTRSPCPIRFVFDGESQPLVRVEDLFRSGLGKTAVRKFVEQARQRHYDAQSSPAAGDPYWTRHGRLVSDWSQSLPQVGSANASELYNAFIRWAGEWEPQFDAADFSQTRWGRIMNYWYRKRRTSAGIVYDGISLP